VGSIPLSIDARFSPQTILAIVKKRKWFIIVPFILIALATYGATYLLTPVFESSVIIWTGSDLVLSTDLQRVMGAFQDAFYNPSERQAQIAGLQREVASSAYILQLVTKLRLDEEPGVEAKAQDLLNKIPGSNLQEAKYEVIVMELRKSIRVELSGREYVRISVTSSNASRAKDIAGALGEIFISEKARQLESRISISSTFSFDQLARVDEQLQVKVTEKTSLEREGLKFQLTSPLASEGNINEINAEIQANTLELQEKKNDESKILSQLTGFPDASLKLKPSPELEATKKEIGSSVSAMIGLVAGNAWNAPTLNGLKLRIIGLEGELEEEIIGLVKQQFSKEGAGLLDTLSELFVIRERMQVLSSVSGGLAAALKDLYVRVDKMPEYKARMDEIDREIASLRELRERLQTEKQGVQISQAASGETRFRLLEPAKVPMKPIYPNRLKISSFGLILGLVIGLGFALALELFDTSIKSVEEAELVLALPVVGTIPKITESRKIFQTK